MFFVDVIFSDVIIILHHSVSVSNICVLSPFLFALYVNDLLINVNTSRLGCQIKSFSFNSVMYADDLILLSISISDMQKMLLICKKSLDDLDLDINIDQSACMIIGSRHVKTDISLLLNDKQLKWKS